MRVGIGHDTHRLAVGRPLILAGVRIEYARGLLGHSDADVVLHALTDALLGAAFTANPSGVGMDVPPWLARMETEFQRLQTSRTALVNLAETLFQVPKVITPFEQLEKLRGDKDEEDE